MGSRKQNAAATIDRFGNSRRKIPLCVYNCTTCKMQMFFFSTTTYFYE